MFRRLEWRKGFGQKEGASEKIEGSREFIFLHNTKSRLFGGTQKLYWRRILD